MSHIFSPSLLFVYNVSCLSYIAGIQKIFAESKNSYQTFALTASGFHVIFFKTPSCLKVIGFFFSTFVILVFKNMNL